MTYNIGQMTYVVGLTVLESIFGSTNRERVLIFLAAQGEGYARQIARFFDTDLSPIQEQLERLEAGGVLISREAGRTVLYQFNPRYAFLSELKSLLEKALTFYPEEERERLMMSRRRPRRRGKPS
jgi:predicted transcriptional regulator